MTDREMKFRAYSPNHKRMGECVLTSNMLGQNEAKFVQWTGLLDKNSKEIYEGDIILFDFNEYDKQIKGEVVFEQGAFVVNFHYIPWDEERSKNYSYLVSRINTECKVVGNIFKTPELIK